MVGRNTTAYRKPPEKKMTKYYVDVQILGNKILHTFYDNGVRNREKITFSPSLYTRSNKEEIYKTIYGQNLTKLDFIDISDAKDHIKQYSQLTNYELYGNNSWENNFISTMYQADSVDFVFSDLSISFLDIETTTDFNGVNVIDCPEEITLITVYNTKSGLITFGSKPYDGKYKETYITCRDEHALLKRFSEYWTHHCPDILSGWNSNTFDVVYIIRRMEKILSTDYVKALSPWKVVRERANNINGKEVISYEIFGVQQLDYLELYRKFRLIPRENYRFDTICEAEMGTGKLKNKYKTFKDWYTQDWENFTDYNIIDVMLIVDLEAKLKLLEVATSTSYAGHVNYKNVFSPVYLWESIINSYLLNQNIIIPLDKPHNEAEKYDGAYVKEPIKGLKGWLCSFDAASLYPSIIMQYNISPETIIEERQDVTVEGFLNKSYTPIEGHTLACNGTMYTKEKQGFLPALMRKFFDSRLLYKGKMIKAKQELILIEEEMKKRGIK